MQYNTMHVTTVVMYTFVEANLYQVIFAEI